MPTTLRIARSRARPAEYRDSLAEAVARLEATRAKREAAQTDFDEAQADVLTIMAAHNIKTSTVPYDDARVKVAVVQAETMSFNERALRKALTAPVYDKLCDLKLNRMKLEEAIADGRVDPVVVATHTTVQPRKPFVKVTKVTGSEQ